MYIPRSRQLPSPRYEDPELRRILGQRGPYRTIEAAGLGRSTIGAIARFGGLSVAGVLGVLFPSELGDAELTELERRKMPPLPKPPTPEQIRKIAGETIAGVAPLPSTPRSQKPTLGPITVSASRRAPLPRTVPAAQGVGPTARASSPAPRPAARAARRIFSPSARTTLTAAVLDLLRSTRPRRSTELGIGVSPRAQPDPLTPVEPRGVPSPQPFPSPFLSPPGSTDPCHCKAKRRSQRRQCKERAEVVWGGGRKKGQKAGTKCVVFRSS